MHIDKLIITAISVLTLVTAVGRAMAIADTPVNAAEDVTMQVALNEGNRDVAVVGDLAARGPLAVETVEFRELIDTSRPRSEAPSRFPRLRQRLAATKTAFPQGRRIPIKVHLPTTGGPYPIILISHGAGGNWDTHFAQAQHLASYGYVVLCLEHTGSNTDRLKDGIRPLQNLQKMIRDANEVLGRPKDVSFALDRATEWNQTNIRLRGRLDLAHVGVMGHSFGAFTTMVICGMRPALDWLEPPVAPGKGLGPDLRDRRIICGVALSPQGPDAPFFIRDSFASLAVPVLGISGTEDQQQGGLPPVTRYQAFELWPASQHQHRFVWLANAHHLDFTDSTGSAQQYRDSPNRSDVQSIVRAATLLFFQAHLKGDAAAATQLTTDGLKPYLHGKIDNVEVRSK